MAGGGRVLAPAAILAATFLTYVVTVDLGFVFDDQVLVILNGSIRSWRFFPGYFGSNIWVSRYPHLLANYYRPFFLTWLRMNDMLFGLHPWGWHLTSALAHVAVTWLVYRLCLRLARDSWVAGIAALLFGLHPVHVEAVAYVSSAQEPLSTFCVLAAVLSFCHSRESGHRAGWLAGSCAFTAAALLLKETGMILPILVGGYGWIYSEGTNGLSARARSALAASIPYWLMVFAYLPLRIWALHGFAHAVAPVNLSTEFLTLPSVLVFYLRLLVWPAGLSCYYDTPYIRTLTAQSFVLPVALLAALVVAIAVWFGRTRRSSPQTAGTIAFASLWMAVTVLPTLNFRLLLAGEIAHDRYLYLPSVGFVLLAAIALRQAAGRAAGFRLRAAWALGAASALGVLMGIVTARQCLFWSDDLVLSVRSHTIAPRNVYATTSLAAAMGARGMPGQAMALYQQALALQPDYWVANRNLGYMDYYVGNYPEAVRHLAQSLKTGPEEGDQFLYLGLSLLHMGRLSEAEKSVRAALLIAPQGRNYHLSLGQVLEAEGRLPEAREEMEKEIAADPSNAQAKSALQDLEQKMKSPAGP